MSEMTPAAVLQHLIRFDTTNPPGNEGPCLAWLRDLFEARARSQASSSKCGRPTPPGGNGM